MNTAETDFQDLVSRTEGIQPWRRVFHAGSGVLIAFGPGLLGLSRWTTVGILAAALVVAVLLDTIRLRVPAWNERFFRLLRVLASPREAERMASSTWYLVGGILAYALFPESYASAAILVLGLSDPAASVLGRLYGTVRLGKGSVQGALVFTLVSLVILAGHFGLSPRVALVALGAALAEVFVPVVDDNLVIPVTTAALLLWLLGAPV